MDTYFYTYTSMLYVHMYIKYIKAIRSTKTESKYKQYLYSVIFVVTGLACQVRATKHRDQVYHALKS